jgi:benzoate membrane transport protein
LFSNIERPAAPPARLQKVFADLSTTNLANGLIGFIFAATGPFAVILSVGSRGGLTSAELASWVFGVFLVNGLLTLVLSWRYQIPLAFGWTIPGTVLVGPALQHLPFSAVIGAFYATSLLILLLGLSGFVKRIMSALPMPIVMGIVAGVLLHFGLDVILALDRDAAIAAPMVLVFFLCSAIPALGRRMPPVIAALISCGLQLHFWFY